MTEPVAIAILSAITAVLGGAVVKLIDYLIKRVELRKEAAKSQAEKDTEEDKLKAELALSDREQMVRYMTEQRAELRQQAKKIEGLQEQNLTLLRSNFELQRKQSLLERDVADYAEDRKQWERDKGLLQSENSGLKGRVQTLETEMVDKKNLIASLQAQIEVLKKQVNGNTVH